MKYVVYKPRLLSRDFVLKKSAWVGVGIKLKQEPGKTSFIFTYLVPSTLVGLLFGGLIALLILRSRFKSMENEIKSFYSRSIRDPVSYS